MSIDASAGTPSGHPAPAVEFGGAEILDPAGGRLAAVDLTVAAGAAHVVVGDAGAGKTALIRAILAARAPARGTFRLFGRDAADLGRAERAAVRRRIGVIHQDLHLLDDLSAFDNAALAPRLGGRRPQDYASEVSEALTWVGLGRRMDEVAGALSPLDRRRLALARAVMGRPELLIADEPTEGLDTAESLVLLRRLAEIHRAGAGLLLATRNRALAEDAGPEVTLLEGGRAMSGSDLRMAPAA